MAAAAVAAGATATRSQYILKKRQGHRFVGGLVVCARAYRSSSGIESALPAGSYSETAARRG